MSGRYVVLGLAQARSPWFRSVAQWANAAWLPVEFVKCVSAVELRAQLGSGRAFSALMVDGGLPSLDRDLIDAARSAGCAVIVVDDLRVTRDWVALGASTVVNPVLGRQDLLDVLTQHATVVGRGDAVPGSVDDPARPVVEAPVATVLGPGGTGSSTAAIALAQGLGDDLRYAGMVLLADLARNGEQAMLHDARDVVPGVQEVAELYRAGRPDVDELRALTFAVELRRYHLLLGLRRARAWASVRPRSFEAAFDGFRRAWRVVVCDTDADLEGEDQGGSADVEDRNLLARTATRRASVVFAVGAPGVKGLHSLVRVVHDLLDHGVDGERIVPVVNRAPRGARSRSEMSSALAALLAPRVARLALAAPVFLPERRVDECLLDGVRLPTALTDPLAAAFHAVADRVGAPLAAGDSEPVRVVPGSLATWSAESEGRP